jgi:hypothetical protein
MPKTKSGLNYQIDDFLDRVERGVAPARRDAKFD